MEGFNNWIIDLNKNSHVWYGVVTVVTMSGLGVLIATFIEVFFKLLGIKGERLESHHK
jgi:hypothetical protein